MKNSHPSWNLTADILFRSLCWLIVFFFPPVTSPFPQLLGKTEVSCFSVSATGWVDKQEPCDYMSRLDLLPATESDPVWNTAQHIPSCPCCVNLWDGFAKQPFHLGHTESAVCPSLLCCYLESQPKVLEVTNRSLKSRCGCTHLQTHHLGGRGKRICWRQLN